jgi:DNA-directed RNA polymerase subunit RPC12/RpoP
LKAFACPQCGASLKSVPIKDVTAECPYCHSAVVVPPELRPPPPPPPPPAPIFPTYEPDKPSFSWGAMLAICGAVTFFLIVFASFIARSGRNTNTSTSRPPSVLPYVPPKATPTPYLFTFGGEGTGPGLFQDAQEVAVDGSGNIYVSDDTLRIQKFDAQGKFLSLWEIPSETKYFSKVRGGPDKLMADRESRVYAVIGGVVLKFDGANGEWLGAASGSDYIYDATLKADGGIVVVSAKGDDDELVVLDAKSKAVKRVHRFISSQLDK